MLIALLADIHANREALLACLRDARARGAATLVFLGDYVGYGADPEFVVECVAGEVEKGAIALLGNHDRAVLESSAGMNEAARAAIEWTRTRLNSDAVAFLKGLPLTASDGDRFYVHADASAPARWNYVLDRDDAALSFNAHPARLIFCGHVHVPALYAMSEHGKVTAFRPVAGAAIPLLRHRRWLSAVGSVGQPRDGSPAGCYSLFNVETCEMSFERVPYDVEVAAAKIRAAGLPEVLAERLRTGR
jgi:diadenosine tetraphosphatase ApaH/serine/threonine PP2A family protein phosphatase